MADGLLVLDKPAGWTSHDVVARTRRVFRTRRVGHAGTLDPMATGVLVLGVGRATRLLTFLVGCDKAYTATIRLGQATLTDDAEGETTRAPGVADAAAVRERLPEAVRRLTGDIMQVPSAVSAIKIRGERSYARVRQGEDVELPARPVTVSAFTVRDVRDGTALLEDGREVAVLDVDVEVEVSSGTYVRALARDLGADLGVDGHLTALRRTRVGGFDLDQAQDLEALARLSEEEGPDALPLVPLAEAAAAQMPVHAVTAEEAVRLGHGQRIPSGPVRAEAVAAVDPQGRLVAVVDESRATARPTVVFGAD